MAPLPTVTVEVLCGCPTCDGSGGVGLRGGRTCPTCNGTGRDPDVERDIERRVRAGELLERRLETAVAGDFDEDLP